MAIITQPAQPRSKREWFRQYLIIPGTTPTTYTLGRDNTSLTADLSWDETDELNVIGEMTSANKLTAVSTSIDTYYARRGDKLSELLMEWYLKRADMDDVMIPNGYGEVYIEEEESGGLPVTSDKANLQDCVILIQSIGGDSTNPVNIPFNIKKIGVTVPATFTVATGTFAPTDTP